ncbi:MULTISPECIES: glycoside hydrolase family 13 protein [Haloferacaceae]|uniref:Alpha-glucosidase n=1 Tax=Halorubrum glutamatedens TaxID=2707018 RepID=A0ABD5QRX5_9EURY|nr:alpha-glucosidase [Halobellus captivus]
MSDTEEHGTSDAGVADREWWKEAVIYQIYPKSFDDSDGDGVGDLPGITERVDYLDDLGVDGVWLCPVYESPMADNGYDISDYRAIDPQFGTMADWEELLEALHRHDVRLIMDLVVNHTSKEHEWFQRSRREEDGYEEFYHWVEGAPDEPPNNWESLFGGSAWTYDDRREAWYLSIFDPAQPDLNWRNPAVREAMTSVAEFWLDRGVDGFRLDAASHLSKADGYPDGDPANAVTGIERFTHGPRLSAYLGELCAETIADRDAVTAAEMGATSLEQATSYLADDAVGVDMIFQFDHLELGDAASGRLDADDWGEWDLRELKAMIDRRQERLADVGWDPLTLSNHDLPRAVSRFGDEAYRHASATLIATFLLTMRGTPFVYQGAELGATNAAFDDLSEVDDPWIRGKVDALLAEGAIDSFDEVRGVVNYRSRDHGRVPMPWTDGPNGGFTEGDPWIDPSSRGAEVDVASARADPDSVWAHYRELIDLRHERDVLMYGDYEPLSPDDGRLFAYERTLGDRRVVVALAWSDEGATFEPPWTGGDTGSAATNRDPELLYGNYPDPPATLATGADAIDLRPYEAVVYEPMPE